MVNQSRLPTSSTFNLSRYSWAFEPLSKLPGDSMPQVFSEHVNQATISSEVDLNGGSSAIVHGDAADSAQSTPERSTDIQKRYPYRLSPGVLAASSKM